MWANTVCVHVDCHADIYVSQMFSSSGLLHILDFAPYHYAISVNIT